MSDAQLGALVSVVSVTVGLGAFPAALLVDRWSRVRAIALMGTVWSLAAAAAGAAQSFGQLLTARAALGAGEAGYGPAAGALLATMFPPARRATVLGAFQAAAPLGATLGVALGGVVAAHWGWRAAFWVFVPPGLAVALLFLRVRDYPTVRLDGPTGARAARGVLRELFRARSGIGRVHGRRRPAGGPLDALHLAAQPAAPRVRHAGRPGGGGHRSWSSSPGSPA